MVDVNVARGRLAGWLVERSADGVTGLLETVSRGGMFSGSSVFGLVDGASTLVLARVGGRDRRVGPGELVYRLPVELVAGLALRRVRRRGRPLLGATLTYLSAVDRSQTLQLRYVCLPRGGSAAQPVDWRDEQYWRATARLNRLVNGAGHGDPLVEEGSRLHRWSHPSPR